MNDLTARYDWSLSPTHAAEVNRACDLFEAAWKAGEAPQVEQFLKDTPQPQRAVLLRELVLIECAYRREAGETPTLEEYRRRFPALDDGPGETGLGTSFVRQAFPPKTLSAATSSLDALARDGTAPDPFAETSPSTADEAPSWPNVPGYEILGAIDRGAMGVVYKARQLSLDRIVALKMIRGNLEPGPRDLSRFRQEARAVASLNHPNIIKIFDFGEHNGLPYFAMEFVACGSLSKKIATEPLSLDEAVNLMELLARAVHHAHEHGLVHRDLKPANVLYSAQGQPIVTDFGLVKLVNKRSTISIDGAIVGTASYMAPEQAGGACRVVGPPADIYALGAILYELLTGRPPHGGKTMLETLLQALTQDPPRPSSLDPGIPKDVEALCLKCLQKDPAQRYPSALHLADDLARFRAGKPLAIATESVLEWKERIARRAGYEVLDLLGCGRAGFLYKARQVKLNRIVALKMLEVGTDPTAEDLKCFHREAETLAKLHHPNIVQVYDCNEQDSQPYFSVEYVDGINLAARFGDTPQPIQKSAELLAKLARTAHYAHERGALHCALKPGNVILTRDGEPKITSFSHALGPAGAVEESSRTREYPSFLASYRAPEQVAGRVEDIGPATDVYGLGTILYKLLTGRPPFLGETVAQTRDQVLNHEPVPPTTLRPEVPSDLEAICLKCLRKQPRDRYAGADSLARGLEKFLARTHATSRPEEGSSETVVDPRLNRTPEQASPATAVSDADIAKAYLVLEVDTDEGRGRLRTFYPAHDRRIILGRGPECDLAIPHRAVSRKHAMILYDGHNGWVLCDLESKGGTFLNGHRIGKATLNPQDRIEIIDVLIHVRDLRTGREPDGIAESAKPPV
jgi:serine/threonine protein kinase